MRRNEKSTRSKGNNQITDYPNYPSRNNTGEDEDYTEYGEMQETYTTPKPTGLYGTFTDKMYNTRNQRSMTPEKSPSGRSKRDVSPAPRTDPKKLTTNENAPTNEVNTEMVTAAGRGGQANWGQSSTGGDIMIKAPSNKWNQIVSFTRYRRVNVPTRALNYIDTYQFGPEGASATPHYVVEYDWSMIPNNTMEFYYLKQDFRDSTTIGTIAGYRVLDAKIACLHSQIQLRMDLASTYTSSTTNPFYYVANDRYNMFQNTIINALSGTPFWSPNSAPDEWMNSGAQVGLTDPITAPQLREWYNTINISDPGDTPPVPRQLNQTARDILACTDWELKHPPAQWEWSYSPMNKAWRSGSPLFSDRTPLVNTSHTTSYNVSKFYSNPSAFNDDGRNVDIVPSLLVKPVAPIIGGVIQATEVDMLIRYDITIELAHNIHNAGRNITIPYTQNKATGQVNAAFKPEVTQKMLGVGLPQSNLNPV